MNNCTLKLGEKEYVKAFEPPVMLSSLLRDVGFAFPCAEKGICGKCRVQVQGSVSLVTDAEKQHLTEKEIRSCIRLACKTEALGDVSVFLDASPEMQKASSAQAFDAKNPLGKKFGFVIDVGTTTVCIALYNLLTGEKYAEDAFRNPQVSFGADVLSRIQASLQGKQEKLSEILKSALRSSAEKLLKNNGLSAVDVDAAVLVGNTAMLTLLFSLSPESISHAPFMMEESFGKLYSADFLPMQDGAKVFVPSCISAFVGADITAASMACTDENLSSELWIDLGTNAETVLRVGDAIYACSCAAGPAFEGVGIECGMPAIQGAVRSVRQMGGVLSWDVIGGGKPLGFCGSGLVDFAACLLRSGEITPDGTLKSGERFYLPGTEVYLSQKDIRSFQLSKSAVRAGLDILLRVSGCKIVEKLSVAGTFGSHLNLRSAFAVGMIPKELRDVTIVCGNAAATGGIRILLDKSYIQKSRAFADRVQTIQLSSDPSFQNLLMQHTTLSGNEE